MKYISIRCRVAPPPQVHSVPSSTQVALIRINISSSRESDKIHVCDLDRLYKFNKIGCL